MSYNLNGNQYIEELNSIQELLKILPLVLELQMRSWINLLDIMMLLLDPK